jgi:glycosyltransferase involved in cell wall biosynthesis
MFCLPSLYEPYGLVLIEAMAHGVPCVGTAVQSIPEILGAGEAGSIVPPGDEGALAAALLELLIDDELAGRLGMAGRRAVEKGLTWDHVAARMLHVIDSLVRV